ncbi:MAG: heavy metal translocating P-type ATPase metal-binding domain-containing protein [Thermodesulfobacteriota bacterium]
MKTTQQAVHSFSSNYCPNQALKQSHCLHCGSELVHSSIVESNDKLFCCTGCRSVYELLHQLGLDDYYKLEERLYKDDVV